MLVLVSSRFTRVLCLYLRRTCKPAFSVNFRGYLRVLGALQVGTSVLVPPVRHFHLKGKIREVSSYAHFNPSTPESDQCQNSPAASQEIWHHTVWRNWLFIAYSDEKWLYYKFSLHHSYNRFLKGWENTLFELRSERVKRCGSNAWYLIRCTCKVWRMDWLSDRSIDWSVDRVTARSFPLNPWVRFPPFLQMNIRHLLRVSGVSSFVYWLQVFAADALIFLVPAVLMLILIPAFQLPSLASPGAMGCLVIAVLLNVPATLSFVYVLSFLFSKWDTCQQIMPQVFSWVRCD